MNVAVIGAGIAGPALACHLRQRIPGAVVTLFESAPVIKEVGAGISLAPNGMKTLRQIGIADLAEATGEKLLTTRASRPDGSTIAVFQNWATKRYQEHMMGFRRARLRRILLDKAQELGAQVQLAHRLTGITHTQQGTSAVLQFDNGTSQEFGLVVGCDGIHSRTRALLKGTAQEPPPRYTGNEVVFAVTKQRHLHLTPEGAIEMVYGPGRKHFGAYGLAEDCGSWFTVRQRADVDDAWGLVTPGDAQEAMLGELRREYDGWVLPQAFFNNTELAVAVRVGVYDRDPAATWTKGVVTLAGDAANPIPPNLGQGGNKALEDVAVLAKCLERHPGDVAAALQLYEKVRLPRAAGLLENSRTASAVSSADGWAAILARNTVLRVLEATLGTLPSDFMWGYDTNAALEAAL